MKTYISDIIPKIRKFSREIDNLTLLTGQHWVVVDQILTSKTVYIFQSNCQLLISVNGKVEKARWESLGNNSLLIDSKDESYLFKQGFLDENILALKVDSRDEYAFFVNESRYDNEINSIEKVISFLKNKYLEPQKISNHLGTDHETGRSFDYKQKIVFNIKEGCLVISRTFDQNNTESVFTVTLNGKKPRDGLYKIGWLQYVEVKDGKVVKK